MSCLKELRGKKTLNLSSAKARSKDSGYFFGYLFSRLFSLRCFANTINLPSLLDSLLKHPTSSSFPLCSVAGDVPLSVDHPPCF